MTLWFTAQQFIYCLSTCGCVNIPHERWWWWEEAGVGGGESCCHNRAALHQKQPILVRGPNAVVYITGRPLALAAALLQVSLN